MQEVLGSIPGHVSEQDMLHSTLAGPERQTEELNIHIGSVEIKSAYIESCLEFIYNPTTIILNCNFMLAVI